jgi:hypothetical protein
MNYQCDVAIKAIPFNFTSRLNNVMHHLPKKTMELKVRFLFHELLWHWSVVWVHVHGHLGLLASRELSIMGSTTHEERQVRYCRRQVTFNAGDAGFCIAWMSQLRQADGGYWKQNEATFRPTKRTHRVCYCSRRSRDEFLNCLLSDMLAVGFI